VVLQADHALLMVLSDVTEVCALPPDQAAPRRHGLNPAMLQPHRIRGDFGRGRAE
jgi:hypothetical protein